MALAFARGRIGSNPRDPEAEITELVLCRSASRTQVLELNFPKRTWRRINRKNTILSVPSIGGFDANGDTFSA